MKTESDFYNLLFAANSLVQKMKKIHKDPLFQSVWFSAANHGIDYTNGPKYEVELDALDEIITRHLRE